MKKLEHIIEPIRAELTQFEAFFEKTLNADTEPMNAIMQYVCQTQGKRLRPLLVLLGAKLFGEVNEQTLRAAAFVEMVHNATLIHDDVVDDDDQRRGQDSVKAHFGNLSAVLSGDYLLAKALQEMLRTAAAMREGELMQSTRSLDYLNIITRKTALLMRSCCAAGALSVHATTEQVQHIADFGLNFGILFQLRDDLLDGENTEQATALLPVYYEKALKALEGFAPSEITETLRDLAVFCAEREE